MFCKALPPCDSGLEPLHMAVADIFHAFCVDGEARLLKVPNMTSTRHPNYMQYPVKVADLREPMIALISESTAAGYFIFDDVDGDLLRAGNNGTCFCGTLGVLLFGGLLARTQAVNWCARAENDSKGAALQCTGCVWYAQCAFPCITSTIPSNL